VIGRKVVLDREARTIIGVMPESFVFPMRGPDANNQPAEFYISHGLTASNSKPRDLREQRASSAA